MPINCYKCSCCERVFDSLKQAEDCELSHCTSSNEKIKLKLQYMNREICDYCANSWYVYGCEQDCDHKDCKYNNNYKDFIAVNPLHDKSISGV